jgi:DNA-binding XRE family transcriptional regulator
MSAHSRRTAPSGDPVYAIAPVSKQLMLPVLVLPVHASMTPPYRQLGQRLRAGRLALPGLTVALLAAAVDVQPATIYQYEAGRHRPRRATLRQLAAVLGIAYDELAVLADYPPQSNARADQPDHQGAAC